MNPSDRTKEALLKRTEDLCNAIYDDRTTSPSGGTGCLSTILSTIQPHPTSSYSNIPSLPPATDYYTSAQKELTVRAQTASLIKTTQDISALIRDLQELWLFGGLDTLREEGREGEGARVGQVAALIEELIKRGGEGVKKEG
ncbi:hypothetical protein BDU57DRAFT_444426 [Ampelomyces quisqualis]|uniref:Uncharacterized protein n=1 Tax=Ampelomyces quisqualis TaxID=50730 RepID=A0A6A5QNX2_AMPQU|nr:hypothetical protein BDU57DRAFT_444426 [Ampelomyces quisqualis]